MRIFFWVFFLLFLAEGVAAQAIKLENPSFEDTPRAQNPPSGWMDCGFENETPPDVQPNPYEPLFGVTKKAYDGQTYLGLVVRDNETWERVSQGLSRPLEAGKCYEFSIYLARSEIYLSQSASARDTERRYELVNFTTPVKLRIWGGVGPCARTELLAESNLVKNTRWLRFDFRFNPKNTLHYITLEAFYNTPVLFPYNGNVLVDNASAIVEVPCEEEIPLVVDVPPPPPPSGNERESGAEDNAIDAVPKDVGHFSQLEVEELSVGTTLRIDKLYFLADSANFTSESLPILEDLYSFLEKNPKLVVEIGGHTNSIPPHSYCDELSTARAKAVADYLISRGIEADRVKYRGYGKRRPIATNKTPEGRKKNQRVEITILSVGSE